LSGPGFFRIMLALVVYISHVSTLKLGVAGVYVFFTLSGFWISHLWTKKYSKSNRAYPIFLISRIWRVWPVFIVASAMTWGLFLITRQGWAPFGNGWHLTNVELVRQIIANTVIFGYSSLPFAAKINGPMWSLDIEAQFYLLAPLFIYLIAKGRAMIIALLAISLGFILFIHIYVMPRYLIFFVAGIVSEQTKWRPSARTACAALVGSILVVVLVALTPPLHGLIFLTGDADDGGKYNHLFSAALALGILPWTVFTTRQEGLKYDRKLGDLAFIFYAVHYPILRFFNINDGNVEKIALSTLFTAAVCSLLWFYDKAVEDMRSAWTYKQIKAHPKAFRNDCDSKAAITTT